MNARVKLIVRGWVQGVGYRAFAQRRAVSLGLSGWVRNRADGSVEILAEGEKSRIESLIEMCRRGPELSEVEDVEVTWEEFKGQFSSFGMRL